MPVPEPEVGSGHPRPIRKAGEDTGVERGPVTTPVSDRDGALRALREAELDPLDNGRSSEIVGKFLRGAEVRNLTVIAGPLTVAGDVNTGGAAKGRTAPRSGRAAGRPFAYSKAHLDGYTAGFVRPDWFEDAHDVLAERHLVVLSGQPGAGRDAASLALLVEVLRGAGPAQVTQLPPEVLGDVTWTVPDKGCGYVIPDNLVVRATRYRGAKPPVTAEAIDDVWLTRMSEQLHDAGSFLVVVTGPPAGRLAVAARRHEFVMEQVSAPDPYEIFYARLEVSDLDVPLDAVRRRLEDTEVAALVAERPRPSFAVRVADAVVAAINSGTSLTEVVRELRDPREQVSEWFGDNVDPAEIAFAMATAVLEGCGYLTVSDAAGDLHRALAGKSAEPATHFRRTLRTAHTWIQLARPERGDGGGAPVDEVVVFRNPYLRLAVLTHAWHELDGMRPAIQEWLRRMAGHSDVEVRARAATAAGVLASGDFQHSLHGLILPWAGSDSGSERQSAALALGVVGSQAVHTGRVWRLLREFAADSRTGPDRPLPKTAAMAAGGPLGLADPDSAVHLLRSLLEADDWNLVHPAAWSFARLVEEGADRVVVAALREWSDAARRGDFAVKVLTAFVIAARPHAAMVGRSTWDTPAVWPVLLKEAARHHDDLPVLWARALAERRVRELALQALRGWLGVADDDPAAYPVVLDVLAGIVDLGERAADDLEHQLEVWASDRRDPSRAAAYAHDDLVHAEEALR